MHLFSLVFETLNFFFLETSYFCVCRLFFLIVFFGLFYIFKIFCVFRVFFSLFLLFTTEKNEVIKKWALE